MQKASRYSMKQVLPRNVRRAPPRPESPSGLRPPGLSGRLINSGQFICYRTGHFYLLLTGARTRVGNFIVSIPGFIQNQPWQKDSCGHPIDFLMKALFATGVPRSGTSLTRELLPNHPPDTSAKGRNADVTLDMQELQRLNYPLQSRGAINTSCLQEFHFRRKPGHAVQRLY